MHVFFEGDTTFDLLAKESLWQSSPFCRGSFVKATTEKKGSKKIDCDCIGGFNVEIHSLHRNCLEGVVEENA